ncbi:MAG: hypothetical protein N3A69_10435, partial [Leptospiraceae bacterium]|nr:hypothetical protein [Leptospiraceae bacterium]
MRTFFIRILWLRFAIAHILQFLFSLILNAETIQIGEENFSKNLEFRNENITATTGSLVLHKFDFIFTRGKNFEGNPPPSRGKFVYEGLEVSNLGEFNNKAIELLFQDKKNISKVENMLEEAVYFDPLFFPTRYNFARVLEVQGKYLEAKAEFLKAKKILPNYYRTYLHLGVIEHKLERHLESSEYLREAAKLNPFHEEAKATLCIFAFVTKYPASYKRFISENFPDKQSLAQLSCEIAKWNLENKHQKSYQILHKIPKENYVKETKGYPFYLHLLGVETSEKLGAYEEMEFHLQKLLESPFDWVR